MAPEWLVLVSPHELESKKQQQGCLHAQLHTGIEPSSPGHHPIVLFSARKSGVHSNLSIHQRSAGATSPQLSDPPTSVSAGAVSIALSSPWWDKISCSPTTSSPAEIRELWWESNAASMEQSHGGSDRRPNTGLARSDPPRRVLSRNTSISFQ